MPRRRPPTSDLAPRYARRRPRLDADRLYPAAPAPRTTPTALSQLGNGSKMGKGYAVAVLVMTCVFSASFSWSCGALYWTIPGEIYPVEVRSAGQGAAVALNLGLNFLQAQCFFAMLCCFKYGMPETKGVQLDSMGLAWTPAASIRPRQRCA